jgi:hypothetical protein
MAKRLGKARAVINPRFTTLNSMLLTIAMAITPLNSIALLKIQV